MRANRPFGSARTLTTTAAEADGTAADLAMDEILDGLAEGFFALDAGWRFVAFNRAAEDIFDLRREDVIGRMFWEVSPTTVGTEFERRYRLVMSKREKQVFETAIRPAGPIAVTRCALSPSATGSASPSATRPSARTMLETLRRRELELARVQGSAASAACGSTCAAISPAHRSPEYLRIHGLPPEAAIESHEDWVAAPPSRRPLARGRASFSRRRRRGDRIQVGIPHRPPERRRGALDPGCRGDRARRERRGDRARRGAHRHHRPQARGTGGASRARKSCGRSPTPCRSSSPTSTATRSSASSTRPTRPGSTARGATSSGDASTR